MSLSVVSRGITVSPYCNYMQCFDLRSVVLHEMLFAASASNRTVLTHTVLPTLIFTYWH